jgi:hypothetical protein
MESETARLAPPFDVIRRPELRRMMSWYLAVRGDRQMIGPGEIDPIALKEVLSRAFYYDYDAEHDGFRLRLAGEEVRSLFPGSVRGARLEDIIPAHIQALVHERYRRIVREHLVLYSAGRVFHTIGRHGHGERLVFPLGEGAGPAQQIFGSTFYDFDAARHRPVGEADLQTVSFLPL